MKWVVAVCAGTKREADRYIKAQQVEGHEYIRVTSLADIRGRRINEHVTVGCFFSLPDAHEILDTCRLHEELTMPDGNLRYHVRRDQEDDTKIFPTLS